MEDNNPPLAEPPHEGEPGREPRYPGPRPRRAVPTRTSVGRDFQDGLLGRLCDQGQITTVYLRNRMSLRGKVLDFDPFVVLMDPMDGGPTHMVYKSAIVSVSGPRPRPPRRGSPPLHGSPRPDAGHGDTEPRTAGTWAPPRPAAAPRREDPTG